MKDSKVRIELNSKGISELLTSPGVMGLIEDSCSSRASAAGAGYDYNVVISKDNHYAGQRAKGFINAKTAKAKRDNKKNNTLLKLL